MPDLIARSPLQGRPPVTLAGCTLSEVQQGRITSVAPFRGEENALAGALATHGLTFPEPGRFVISGSARLVWTGRDQAFLIAADPTGLAPHAALTDQSDGWAALALDGPGAEAVLARIVPLDVREPAFPQGRCARIPFNHLSTILMRIAPETFHVLVFRSMARTAWHEAEAAMTALAARQRIA